MFHLYKEIEAIQMPFHMYTFKHEIERVFVIRALDHVPQPVGLQNTLIVEHNPMTKKIFKTENKRQTTIYDYNRQHVHTSVAEALIHLPHQKLLSKEKPSANVV